MGKNTVINSLARTLLIIFIMIFCMTQNFQPTEAIERENNLNHFGIGARAIGLNNAYTASCNDYTAPFWNPAAMGFFTTRKIGAMRTKMSLNREINFLSFVLSTKKLGTFGLAWAGFGVKNIEARTENTIEPDSYFNSTENTFFLTYAYRILPVVSIGGNLKLLTFNLQDKQAIGGGMDLSLFYIPFDRLRIGLIAQDIGASVYWSTRSVENFSKSYRLGCSFVASRNVLISCDYYQTLNKKARFALATEISTFKFIKIRCGFEQQRVALGLGFILPIRNTYLSFNYAIATDQLDAGMINVFDLSVVF